MTCNVAVISGAIRIVLCTQQAYLHTALIDAAELIRTL